MKPRGTFAGFLDRRCGTHQTVGTGAFCVDCQRFWGLDMTRDPKRGDRHPVSHLGDSAASWMVAGGYVREEDV